MKHPFDIRLISLDHLKTFYENAIKSKNLSRIKEAEDEFGRRGLKAGNRKPNRSLKELEDSAADDILRFALDLETRYDLSEIRAKESSKSYLGFRPHSFLGRIAGKPAAKTGGPQRNGEARLDRYVSYRYQDRFIALNFILECGKDLSEGYWLLSGCGRDAAFEDGIALVPTDKGIHAWAREHGGVRFFAFQPAAAAFEKYLGTFAPKNATA